MAVNNPWTHLHAKHKSMLKLSRSSKEEIRRALDHNTTWRPEANIPVARIRGVPLLDAFACLACGQCALHKKNISCSCGASDNITPCKAHRLALDGVGGATVRVLGVTDEVEEVSNARKLASELMQKRAAELRAPAAVKEINPFYRAMGWFTDPEELASLRKVDAHKFLEVSPLRHPDWSKQVVDILLKGFQRVETLGLAFLKLAGYNRIEEETKLQYAKQALKLVNKIYFPAASMLAEHFSSIFR
jgi:hypothetical protein